MKFAKRVFALLLIVVLALGVYTAVPHMGITAYADSTTMLTVKGDVVNVRKGAGTSYSKLTTVTNGTVLTSLGTSKDSSGTVWYKVRVSGTTGYIVSTYVTAKTIETSTKILTVTGSTVNVRSGAGVSNKSLTMVKKGATYQVLGSTKDSSGNVWYKISVNGTTGYIIGTYVKVSESSSSTTTTTQKPTTTTTKTSAKQSLTVKGDVVNVRKGAGTSYSKVTTVKQGATYTVLGSAKDSSGKVWYKISVNGTTGYIISTYVTVSTVTTTTTTTKKTTTASATTTTASASGSATTTATAATTTTVSTTAGYTGTTLAANTSIQVISYNVDVYTGAGEKYSVMTTLTPGDIMTILSNKLDAQGNLWYRISYASINGYVKAETLTEVTAVTTTTTTTAKSTASSQTTQNDMVGNTTSKTTSSNTTTTTKVQEATTTNNSSIQTGTVKKGVVVENTILNVRCGPGTNYSVMGTLKTGDEVTILESKNGWYKIEYNNSYGYVMDDFITSVTEEPVTVTLAFGKSYYYVNQGATVKLSVNAGSNPVSYSSEDNNAAPVSSAGVVTGNTPGLYTITVKSGDASATTEVVVLKAPYSNIAPMTISAEGTSFIAQWEGGGTAMGDQIVFYPYQDVSKYWTIGYGHAITSAESKSWSKEKAIAKFNEDITARLGEGHELTDEKPYLTQEEAEALLTADLNEGPYVAAVSEWAVRNGVKLTQHQFDALVSFCYNLGPSYWTSDTYYFYLKSAIIAYRSGDDAVPEQVIEGFTRYIKSGGVNLKGLWWRRRNEAEMFLEADYNIDRENKFTLPNLTWS